jgi:DNA repair exonuclease SbcCD nuclease subunit
MDRKVGAVLIAGDIFDTPKPPAKAVLEMTEFVRRLEKNNVPVYGIEGNHDKTPNDYWLKVCGIIPLQDSECELGDNTIACGLDFDRSENILTRLEELASENLVADIVVLHLGLAEMGAGFNPDLSVQQLAPRLKALGCKYCALGHIHIPYERRADGVWFVQPGSLELKSIDEPQNKGVEIFEIKDGEVTSMERVPYKTRQMEFLELNTDADVANLTEARAKELADKLVVAYVSNTVQGGVGKVADWAKQNGIMCRVMPVGTDAKQQKEYDRSNSMNLLKEAVETFFDEGSEQYKMVMDILATGNPRLIVEKYLNGDKLQPEAAGNP